MKILITNDLSNAMEKQPKDVLNGFIESIDKLQDLVKPQILLLETVVDLSSPDDETKLYAYNISGKSYAVFAFTPKNEMLLLDYVQVTTKGITSLAYPSKSTSQNS